MAKTRTSDTRKNNRGFWGFSNFLLFHPPETQTITNTTTNLEVAYIEVAEGDSFVVVPVDGVVGAPPELPVFNDHVGRWKKGRRVPKRGRPHVWFEGGARKLHEREEALHQRVLLALRKSLAVQIERDPVGLDDDSGEVPQDKRAFVVGGRRAVWEHPRLRFRGVERACRAEHNIFLKSVHSRYVNDVCAILEVVLSE